MTRERRTKIDWAHCIRRLFEERYSEAEKLILVMDNLNIHRVSGFYEAFLPERVFRLS